eukprot:scaffold213_cov94-Cylindrotheca_fusiformis.AAC.4
MPSNSIIHDKTAQSRGSARHRAVVGGINSKTIDLRLPNLHTQLVIPKVLNLLTGVCYEALRDRPRCLDLLHCQITFVLFASHVSMTFRLYIHCVEMGSDPYCWLIDFLGNC